MKRNKPTLAISKRQALRDMAITIDTIETMCASAKTREEKLRAITAVRIVIREMAKALQGKRPSLESSKTVGKVQVLIQNDLAEETMH